MHGFITLASCWVASSTAATFVQPSRHHITSRRTHDVSLQKRYSSSTDLSQLTVHELKEQLRQISLPVGGRKQELIDRLNEYHSSGSGIEQLGDIVPMERSDVNNLDTDGVNGSNKDLESMTVPELRERLKTLGLPVGGLKQELINRLIHSQETSISNKSTIEDEAQEMTTIDDIIDSIIRDESDDFDGKTSENQEDPKSRRARRKKYFKTQEVRELIRANDPRAPKKAEEMIVTLELMAQEENDDNYLPGPKQYTALIDAYSNSDTRSAEAVIERILKSDLLLTPTMMNAIMGVYANMATLDGAREATTILERMEYSRDFGSGEVKPTVYSYSLAISAWAKCGSIDSATCAENILTRLLCAYERASSDSHQSEYAEELRPNSVVFNSAIDAWANSGSSISGEKAEELLKKMEVYSRMDRRYDIRPDTITFNTCIKAWCNSRHPDAPERAEELLTKLEEHPEYPRKNGVLVLRPNLLSYNTCINSWAQSSMSNSAARAEALLTRMLKRYKEDAFSTVKPDVVTFSSVLNALAKSRVQHKAMKCLTILDAMIDLHEEDGSYDTTPNIICFNTILNACAFSARAGDNEKREAMSAAVKTFKMLRETNYARPDALSYGNMLKCIANLMPIGVARTSMASRIFSNCCEAGMVGGMALDEIRRCISSKEFLKLLSKCGYGRPLRQHSNAMSVTLKSLPPNWTANVKRGDLAARQRIKAIAPKRERTVKNTPVYRNPTYLVEPSWASGKDL